jgi:hypothetical protein
MGEKCSTHVRSDACKIVVVVGHLEDLGEEGDNIKTNQVKGRWRILVNQVMKRGFHKEGNMTSYATSNFWRRNVLHGISYLN